MSTLSSAYTVSPGIARNLHAQNSSKELRFAGWVGKLSKDWATYLKNYTSYPSKLTVLNYFSITI